MPYMTRPDTEIPMYYGVKLVVKGELVLVKEEDVMALLSEGWALGTENETTTNTPIMAVDHEG